MTHRPSSSRKKTAMSLNSILMFVLASASLAAGCSDKKDIAMSEQQTYVPVAPDYADPKMWVTYENDATGDGADVFYIPSTWEYDWTTPDSLVCHYADVTRQQHLDHMAIEMNAAAEYMADGNNFYSPFYRHITLDSWATLNEDTISRRYGDVSLMDVRNAFDRYLSTHDGNRPIILAGFSQGAKSVVELLKTMPGEVRDRLVAAYVLGYKVTPSDTEIAPWIVAAQGATDTGVTICYNSVSDVRYVKPIVAAPNVMCINPVNWRTDATPSTLNDTITVTLDPEHKVLVLDGFDGSYLPNILDILNVGDYHGIEPWLYSDCLRQNFKQRLHSYRTSPRHQ